MSKKKKATFVLSENVIKKLKLAAISQNISYSTFVENLILDYLNTGSN